MSRIEWLLERAVSRGFGNRAFPHSGVYETYPAIFFNGVRINTAILLIHLVARQVFKSREEQNNGINKEHKYAARACHTEACVVTRQAV